MLLDTSGTYTDEIGKAQQIVDFTLSRLNPGDSFAIARIDTASFSQKDIKEDLQEGYVRDFSMTFTDVDVVAMNVTKLRSDNVDPREYLDRLADWEARVQQGGGRWWVINDLDRLDRLFQS